MRTILAFAIKRGRGIEDCRKSLDITAMLEVANAQPLDPKPIAVETFWTMYKTAKSTGDTVYCALLLVSANLAMYGGEFAALQWSEINLKNGEVVTRRPKKGVSRVGILWTKTIAALKAIPRKGKYIVNTTRNPYVVNSVLKAWRQYRLVLCQTYNLG